VKQVVRDTVPTDQESNSLEAATPGSSPGLQDPTAEVVSLFLQGAEPSHIFAAVAEAVACATKADSVSVSLRISSDVPELTNVFSTPGFVQEPTYGSQAPKVIPLNESSCTLRRYDGRSYLISSATSLDCKIGCITALDPQDTSPQALAVVVACAKWLALAAERQRMSSSVQNLLDRLQVLNQLTSLVAANTGFRSMLRSVTRQAAFRFGADLVLIAILSEATGDLQLFQEGTFGCDEDALPQTLSTRGGLLGQVLNLGGHIAVQDLASASDPTLHILSELGFTSVDLQCIDVHGNPLGVLILGSRQEQSIAEADKVSFEEFCQAAAVALANARSQQQIQDYSEKLESLVEQRTQELEHQKALAEQANTTKSQFLANMSHELRTPLTAIMGYSSILKEGIFGPVTERQMEAISAISHSSEHLKNLIDDVLNLARVESGKEDPEPRNIRVQDLLTQSYKLMMQTAIKKGVKLEQPLLAGADKEVSMHADPKHTQQILINLLSNAVKYTPKGGSVSLAVEIVVDKVRISVSDTGVGIPPSKQATLFERFERGEDDYSKSQEGTGIGLNLTRRLTELNGGRIGVTSTEGQGSTFWIMLPIARSESQSIVQECSEVSAQSLDGLTLIVVDDNPVNCDILSAILSKAGASVHIANSVRDGVSLLTSTTPDIILTDLAMPKESGLDLIQKVRDGETSGQQDIPIIVLSACAFNSDKEAALSAGADMFIVKPFKPTEVIQSVRNLTLERALAK
jgi:signal transduction histidine kinase/ActR/RegA family two-component response regulator